MARAGRTDADVAARRALTRHAARQVRSALPAMALAIGVVALLLRPHVEPRALAWWIAAGIADLLRAGLRSGLEVRRSVRGGRVPSRWWDNVNHASFGLLWGGLGVTAARWGDDTAVWSALVVVLGVIAMATVVSAAVTHRFVIIVVCVLGPTTAVLLQRPQWRVVGACVVVFAGIAFTVQRALHRALADAVQAAEENRRLADQLARFLADRDPATSLLSRRGFASALDDLGTQAARSGRELTVVVANVERLASVNELFGEHVGDALICALAARLQDGFGVNGGLVGRLGGDEFAIALDHDASARLELAARVRDIAVAPVAVGARVVQTELHVAEATGAPSSHGDLVGAAAADVTRMRAQRRGGVRDAVDPLSLRRALLDDLEAGLVTGDVAPWFQPIVGASTLTVVGWEALVRWRHPSLGVLGPDRFLPLAMMGGHGAALTDVVLDGALAFVASTPPSSAVRMHVNIDPSDLRRAEFPERVLDRLHAHRVAADALVLEITEQDVLAVDDLVLANLGALDRAGVEIAIDDFGTGYSSMSHLQLLPVRQLKIDRTFIAALDRPRASTLVEGIVGLARGMRLGVVAEGVETAAQAERLAVMGCGELQGFLFSPAVPAEDAAAQLGRPFAVAAFSASSRQSGRGPRGPARTERRSASSMRR